VKFPNVYGIDMPTRGELVAHGRTDDEVACWQPKDPLVRFWAYLQKKKVMDDKGREVLEEEINGIISEAVSKAESYEPDPTEPFRHCFAEQTPDLKEQYAEFQSYMDALQRPNNGNSPQPDPIQSRVH